ncbi:MAG: phytanoyl-CoA dioxygenase family protein [Chitinophagaceae bacterium]|nr:phytanoyl-CoA dioxygenase family protein [Chitinophagaceae bacterium]
MNSLYKNKEQILSEGFTIIDDVFSSEETDSLVLLLNHLDTSNPNFRKTNDLFAIRQFLKEVPAIRQLILNEKLCTIIKQFIGQDYFIVKSVYFDKPEQSNWFVAYHQDLTIAVDKKNEIEGFVNWTVKQNHFAVQPPLHMLQNNFTIRIHVDDTDENNGALKVIPGSHLKGIYRPEKKIGKAKMKIFAE